MQERIIRKVWKNKSNDQLLVYIPKNCGLKEGEFVELIKVPEVKRN